MEFLKYQHIERLGTDDTRNIEIGECFIFPKIDGTNSQLWYENGLQAGSRNRHLEVDNDNAGFYNWALKQEMFYLFFAKYKNLRLFGEWLVPHTLKTYQKTAWNNFYVFDVMNGDDYLHYETYKSMLDEFGIEYIPPIAKINNPTFEQLINMLDKNIYLIKDGEGVGEGIVIKNYNFINQFNRVCWAKIVRNEFKEKHAKNNITEINGGLIVEEKIVEKFVTEALVEKEFSKIETVYGWTSGNIPRLLSTIYYCLITEEMWNILKEFKNPTIDFKKLSYYTTLKIKELKSNIF